MSLNERTIRTSHADISVVESTGKKLPILLIHGNSSCKEVFRRQMEGDLAATYRMIAIDLPGHGHSSDAHDPQRTYSMRGYADVAVEVLAALGIAEAAVYGWSLGGHIALEMLPKYRGMVGLMISGTPPVMATPESIQGGFQPNPLVGLLGKEELTPEEMEAFATGVYGAAADATLRAALKRTDGRSRSLMFQSLFGGANSNQKELAEKSPVPLAIVDGADDPFVNLGYISSLPYTNLWERHCYVLRGLGHAPFLTGAEAFNPILTRFMADMAKRAGKRPGTKNAAA
jgi:pimeloyl-ACP methyl ester carboxylesterase